MNDSGKFVAGSLEDLLVSLADGVREAQHELRSTPILDEFGRQVEQYHFPYIDFEFEVSMDTANSSSPGRTLLKIGKSRGSRSRSSAIKSSLSGRLVAVPPGQGLPRPSIAFQSTKDSARKFSIEMVASNEAGEILTGHQLELNLNLDASSRLSETAGIAFDSFPAGTGLDDAVLATDETGTAKTRLSIGQSVKPGTFLVITAELLGESHNHTIGF